MKKAFKLFAGILVLSTVFVACSSNSATDTNTNTSGTEQTPTNEQVNLRMSWWGSDSRHVALTELTQLYTEKNPNVTIDVEYGAFDGWLQKVLAQLAGKTEPDIVQVNYNWVHSFGKGQNVFYDLNTVSNVLDLSNWDQVQLDAMTVGGELAAVPHGVTARANLYNKALFAEYGIQYPATYEELMAAGQIIGAENTPTGAHNQYVLTNIGKVSTDLFIAQMLYNNTGKVMQTDGVVNYTIEEVANVFDQYMAFEASNALPTFIQEDPIQNESNPVWTSGRSGSVYEWIGTMDKYLLAYKNGEAVNEIGVAPYITENAGEEVEVFIKPSLGFAISKNTKHPEIAADFLNFMFTDEEAIKLIGTQLGASSNAVSAQVQTSAGIISGAMAEGFELLDGYTQVVLDPYFEDESVRGERYNAVEALRSGSSTSEEAAKAFVEKQQEQLDRLFY